MKSHLVKKAILPMAGLGTRFLPLSKVFPKELWPVLGKPVVQYILEEIKNSGIKEVIFVISPEKKIVFDYFKKNHRIEAVLKARNKNHLLEKMEELARFSRQFKFSYVWQKDPLGDGHAILQAKKVLAGKEPVAISFADDIVFSKIPCLKQLSDIFEKTRVPITKRSFDISGVPSAMVALAKVPEEKLSLYGVVEAEKIGPRLYRLKKIVEKPAPLKAPSNLAIVGKYILTPAVFEYLKKAKPGKRGEIILAEAFEKMIKDGKIIYGYKFEGKWLECGTIDNWLKTNVFLARVKKFKE